MKIICIGNNYFEHIKELNSSIPEEPIFFLKPDTSLVIRNHPFYYPDFSNEIHHEVEIVIKINKKGRHILEKFAPTYYNEIGIGIDFTARDIQKKCKEKGLPWEISKAFDLSAPISNFINKSQFENINNLNFHLQKNGKTIQTGNSSDMIFSFDSIISYVSRFITIKMGDMIFTGTPYGVGPVKIGDKLEAFLGDEKMLKCEVK